MPARVAEVQVSGFAFSFSFCLGVRRVFFFYFFLSWVIFLAKCNPIASRIPLKSSRMHVQIRQ
jgi:hypothetical protein